MLNVELLYDLSLIKEVPQFKIENLKFNRWQTDDGRRTRESMRGRRSSLVGGRKKKKHSPQRHRGHKGEKMQGRSAEVTEKRGLWLVDCPSLL
jgi:hypothetical protein